jgi:hypothetical protein
LSRSIPIFSMLRELLRLRSGGLSQSSASAGSARRAGRYGSDFCASDKRIWRNIDAGQQHSRTHPDDADRYLSAVEGGDMRVAFLWVSLIVVLSLTIIRLLHWRGRKERRIRIRRRLS